MRVVIVHLTKGMIMDDETYNRLIPALLAARDEDAVKTVLCEIADIIPASVRALSDEDESENQTRH